MSFIIAIAGGSCSGKTTLAHLLHRRLGADNAMLIRQDDYYFDIRARKETPPGEIPNFDIPEAVDFATLASDLTALNRGESVTLPNYDFTTHQRVPASEPAAPKRFTIVEGLLLLNDPRIREIADHTLYMRCEYGLRYQRRLARDTTERGRTEEFVREQFARDVEPAHQSFIQPSAQYADRVIEQELYLKNTMDLVETIAAQAMEASAANAAGAMPAYSAQLRAVSR